MNKQHILDEIRRTAKENGGTPLGKQRFEKQTGIREGDWAGRYWIRWGDAIKEAGLAPNSMNVGFEDDHLLSRLATLSTQLGYFPVSREMRMHRRSNLEFPDESAYRRFGSKNQLIEKLLGYGRRENLPAVVALCEQALPTTSIKPRSSNQEETFEVGYVYLALMKVGREKRYKIGKADIVERRKKQIGPHLPEELELIHTVSTDDAYGIEAYWHKRFDAKRRGGEWFDLAPADVRAFKRRKFM